MVPVFGKPFLIYLLNFLVEQNFNRVILSVGYKSEHIKNYFNNLHKSITIKYSKEESPLGTGGAIKKAIECVTSRNVLVLNGDSLFNIDLNLLYKFHIKNNSNITIALKTVNERSNYGSIEIDEQNRIINFSEKKYSKNGYINGGIYIIDIELFQTLNHDKCFSIELDVFQKQFNKLLLYGLPFNSQFIDIGTIDNLNNVKLQKNSILSNYNN